MWTIKHPRIVYIDLTSMRFFSTNGEFGSVFEPPAEIEARNAIKNQD